MRWLVVLVATVACTRPSPQPPDARGLLASDEAPAPATDGGTNTAASKGAVSQPVLAELTRLLGGRQLVVPAEPGVVPGSPIAADQRSYAPPIRRIDGYELLEFQEARWNGLVDGVVVYMPVSKDDSEATLRALLGPPHLGANERLYELGHAWYQPETSTCGFLTEAGHQEIGRLLIRPCPSLEQLFGEGRAPHLGFSQLLLDMPVEELLRAASKHPFVYGFDPQDPDPIDNGRLILALRPPPEWTSPLEVWFYVRAARVVGYRIKLRLPPSTPPTVTAALSKMAGRTVDTSRVGPDNALELTLQGDPVRITKDRHDPNPHVIVEVGQRAE